MKVKRSLLKSLKVQIVLYFLIASMASIIFLGIIAYYSSSNMVLNNQLAYTKTSVEQSGKYIEVYLEKLKAQADVIAKDSDTISYLSDDAHDSKDRVMQLIQNTLETDQALVSIIIVGKNGRIISNEEGLDMSLSADMMKEAWYVEAIQSDMPVLTSARRQSFTMDKSSWVIAISQEIKGWDDENLGVLLIDISYRVIESYLEQLNLGDTGYAFIVNDAMELVYHPDVSYFENKGKRDALQAICDKTAGYDEAMGMLTHKYQIQHSDWLLIGLSSLDELFHMRRQIIEILVLAGILLTAIALVIGWFMAEKISKPIKVLESAMLDVASAMEEIQIDDKAYYEVVSLTEHYNKMIQTIRQLMTAIKQNEDYLRTYEIKALHSQINPHFLYNTLDTIVWMAEFNDRDKVIAVTKSLAQFFRLSLSKGQEMIPLKDELDHVAQYLFIQKQRYDEQLNYRIESNAKYEHLMVPKIILQPIVENALYHGIKEKEQGGHISIRLTDDLDGRLLKIFIEDDGVGFDLNRMKENSVQLGGIGLANVDQRLKLYYGEDYGLEINSEINRGTTVILLLPIEKL